jgi:hypothetical protein
MRYSLFKGESYGQRQSDQIDGREIRFQEKEIDCKKSGFSKKGIRQIQNQRRTGDQTQGPNETEYNENEYHECEHKGYNKRPYL